MNAKFHSRIALSFLTVFLTSCSEGTEKPELQTFPISGHVTVDGAPGDGMQVICNSPDLKAGEVISGFTDAEGNFKIGTQEKDDGAPVGTYKLTFMWGTRSLMTGRYQGPDKLKELYSDPEKSEFTVVVKPGDPIELGEIQLTIANAPDTEAAKPSLKIDSEGGGE